MAYQSIWYFSKLSEDIIDIFLRDFEKEIETSQGLVGNGSEVGIIDEKIRKNKIGWVSDTNWFSSLIYSYALKANRENFLYDISQFEGNTLQYTYYDNSNFYKWHTDSNLASLYLPTGNKEIDTLKTSSEFVRKLTVSVQLSDPSEYEGGELQIMDYGSKVYTVPKERGTVAVFDSRAMHRVRSIKSGERKSLVGWLVGPRWK